MKLKDHLYYSESGIRLYNADCLDTMRKLPDNYVDLIVTDPPYGYSFMGKDWDTFNEIKDIQKEFANTVYAKKGFKKLPRNKPFGMIKFFLPIWKEVLRILKPGAFAFVMCAPRQDVLTKQITALQEAGFRTDFTSIYWTYASGFPKASNIGKKVDKRLKVKRKKLGIALTSRPYTDVDNQVLNWGGHGHGKEQYITKATSSQAKELDGSYGGFQPKPAVEIIIVAMKPLSKKTYVDQALKNGKGITWLDNCRVPYKSEKDIIPQIRDNKREVNAGKMYRGNSLLESKTKATIGGSKKGRFPANLLVSDNILNDGKIRKGQQGATTGKEPSNYKDNNTHGDYKGQRKAMKPRGDIGSYSRYFDLDKWWIERVKKLPPEVQKVLPYLIVPKASKSEKNKGCGKLLIPEYRWNKGGICQQIKGTKGNKHPTVKPLKLMSYLITLGSSKNDIILDPFAGSGTTLIASKILNRKGIGIELNKEYCKIAKARIKGN